MARCIERFALVLQLYGWFLKGATKAHNASLIGIIQKVPRGRTLQNTGLEVSIGDYFCVSTLMFIDAFFILILHFHV